MDLIVEEEKTDVNDIMTAIKNVNIVNVINAANNLINDKAGVLDLYNLSPS